MKIEKRDSSVFVSHNGLTIFNNALKDGSYILRVTVRDASGKWTTAGEMELTKDDYRDWVEIQKQV